MKPDQKPSEPPTDGESPEQELEEQLLEVEQALAAFKERYNQVQADRSHQQELQQRRDELHHSKQPGLKTELRHIQQQLEELELRLESKLFSWKSLKEPFWLAVRFGGLGVIIGWLIK
ncbi:hypothetical protein [Scytonema sp. NUACC26]|uniref:hypothetical protein n=1 Tax=Scytonema sp. NUACC26 TaxID=3140176 RepID=UPI0034DC1AF0